MKRQRTFAASPVRSAAEAWDVVSAVIAKTLERSPEVPNGSVAGELAAMDGLAPALIAGGHLESEGLVLYDVGLHVTIRVVTSDAALAVTENRNPIPGGGSATEAWMLYLPSPGALNTSVARAAKRSSHLSVNAPPKSAPSDKPRKREVGTAIDLEALGREASKW